MKSFYKSIFEKLDYYPTIKKDCIPVDFYIGYVSKRFLYDDGMTDHLKVTTYKGKYITCDKCGVKSRRSVYKLSTFVQERAVCISTSCPSNK